MPEGADSVIALTIIACVFGAVALTGILSIIARFAPTEEDATAPPPARHYVTNGARGSAVAIAVSSDWNAETEKTETPETAETPPAPLDITALRHDVRAAALGALLAHGLVKDGARTAAVRAVFGEISGEAYSRAARAVRAYEARIVPPSPVPVLTPVAERPVPTGVEFAETP